MNTLQNYTETLLRLELFKKLHAKTFSELEHLENELANVKLELVDEIKQSKVDIENENVSAKYVERYRKGYDYETFMKLENKEEYEALFVASGIDTSIDKKVFDECVKRGDISRETKQAIFKEKLLSTSVLIKSKI